MSLTARRLAGLPAIFTASDALLLAKIPPAQLNQVLWRWKTAGLVKPLGHRAEVWFNLVVDPAITRDRWEQGVRLALPAAVLAGHSVLMRSGLSTQMAAADYLIRPAKSASAAVDGAELHVRPAMWVRKLWRAGAVRTTGGLPELDPGAALADLLQFEPGFDLDEIDLDELTPASRGLLDSLLDGPIEMSAALSASRNRRRDTDS